MKRILVVGSGGAGKSTFSARLGHILKIGVIHLDKIYWKPNWVETEKQEWKKTVDEILRGDSWILDGNYGGTIRQRVAASDTVIWLDLPRSICIYRVLKRFVIYRNRPRPDMNEGCNERLTSEFLWWIWNYKKSHAYRLTDALEESREKTIIVLKTKKEIEDFLVGLERDHN